MIASTNDPDTNPAAARVSGAPRGLQGPAVIGWIAAGLIAAAYLACIVRLTSFPMQDYANHVARAAVMADLLFHHGAHFGGFFQLHLAPVPYVLPDLILASAVEVLGAALGAGMFTGLVLLCLPCALLFYAHACGVVPRARPFIFLVGLYLSTDWFFVSGFMAYRLALALIVVSLALAEMLRARWSAAAYAVYLIVLVTGLLTHLTAPLFMGAALGTSAVLRLWFKSTTLRREIYLLMPVGLLLAWYFAVMAQSHADGPSLDYSWAGPGPGRAWGRKIRNLLYEFIDFNWRLATPALLLFAACLLWPVRRELGRPATLMRPAVLEQLALAAAFLGIYFVLPYEDRYTLYVDIRTLPMIALALLFACLRLPAEGPAAPNFGTVCALLLATALALVNLTTVAVPLERNNAWINRYRQIAAFVPQGAYVLPVHTESPLPHLLHVASHVVIDRGAVFPYLFSGDSGDPMSYFRYNNPRYAPTVQWYRFQLHEPKAAMADTVDWIRVACDYDYLLVTMPFDAAFIRVPTLKVAANDAAALMAIDKKACVTSGAPATNASAENAPATGAPAAVH